MKYFSVYIENISGTYTYCSEENFKKGDRVLVSFMNKDRVGLIVDYEEKKEYSFKILEIKKYLPEELSFSASYIDLLLWIKEYYLASFDQIFSTAVPAGMKIKYKEIFRINDENNTLIQDELLEYLLKKPNKQIGKTTLVGKFDKKIIERHLREKNIILEKIYKNAEKNIEKIEKENSEDKNSTILNEEQEKIKNEIENSTKKHYLIKGVTGSGKTEIYIHLIKNALLKGKGSIFLVPEISLTPQMVGRFRKTFGDEIAVLHSKLTNAERAKEWYQIYLGEKKIVIGARSAVFAPVKNLEYIIIDEEHENSYKQENNPKYNAKFVAIKRADLERAKLILGSATPSVESNFYAKKNVFQLLEIENRYKNASLPEIEIIDMKEEKNTFFSEKLLEEIKKTLIKKEQILLLLNRKGYSTLVQCKTCGHMEECEHCSIKMSYHISDNRLKCNYCGISKEFKGVCSKCGSKDLQFSGRGVEKVESELRKIFDANIIRVDGEAAREKGFFEKMYSEFLDGKYDIMIGTQMISRGLHFPNVTLVGVVNADTIINIPDFRMGERTFQMITQVAGRAGRGEKKGKVIIQTFQPENEIFKKIQDGNYNDFYESEIESRKILTYPPFSKIINIGISSESEDGLEEYCEKLFKAIKNRSIEDENIENKNIENENIEIYGPMKSLVYKVKNKYRYNIFIKGQREDINEFKKTLLEKIESVKNKKYRVVVDVDPITLI